jgi:hypothetical protein
MHCFYEPHKEAVGLCKHCYRALCSDCLTEEGTVLACKGRCEESVKALNSLIAYNKRAVTVGYPNSGMVFILIGALFLGWGAFTAIGDFTNALLPLVLGLLILFIGIFNYRRVRKIEKPTEQ